MTLLCAHPPRLNGVLYSLARRRIESHTIWVSPVHSVDANHNLYYHCASPVDLRDNSMTDNFEQCRVALILHPLGSDSD